MYFSDLMQRLHFPKEAIESLIKVREALLYSPFEKDFDKIKKTFLEEGEPFDESYAFFERASESLKKLSRESGLNLYSLWMIFFLELGEYAEALYQKKGWSKALFEHTFEDLRYKLMECRINKGQWGTFVAGWYPIFIFGRILAHGRLQYEDQAYPYEEPYQFGDIRIEKGCPILNLHIPNSGEPLTKEARLASYREAWAFYQKEGKLLPGNILAVGCHSWLLYPPYQEVFPEGSNIRDFASDFQIIHSDDRDFYDFWRVFGPKSKESPEALPEGTRLQKAFKAHILKGGPFGDAAGILLFDGERIINQ